MSHLNEGASGVRNSSKLKILIINFFTLFVKKATKIVKLAEVPKRMTMMYKIIIKDSAFMESLTKIFK